MLETLREQEFTSAQGHLARAEARIAAIKAAFRAAIMARGGTPGERIDATSMLDRERYLLALHSEIVEQERFAEGARIVAEERRVALVAARQAREAVLHLRDQEAALYAAGVQRSEQELLDEMATLRHTRGARETAREEAA